MKEGAQDISTASKIELDQLLNSYGKSDKHHQKISTEMKWNPSLPLVKPAPLPFAVDLLSKFTFANGRMMTAIGSRT